MIQQHPIPHNILDVEFKLVGALTIKQFAYVGIFTSIGGIFLYSMATNPEVMPPWLAIPSFILFAGIGAFLGLAKIGNQSGDEFLKNFIRAISRPTRRVWKSKNFEQKIEDIMAKRQQNYTEESVSQAGIMTKERPKLDTNLDPEEIESLQRIQKEAHTIQTQSPQETSNIYITPQNISNYAVDLGIEAQKLGSFTFYVLNKSQQALKNVMITISNSSNQTVFKGITNDYGLLTTPRLPSDTYDVFIKGDPYIFPSLKIVLTVDQLPIIKIVSRN